MPQHFLKYWRWQSILDQLNGKAPYATHAASEQYARIKLGDVIWFVCVEPESGSMYLAGRLNVGWIGSRAKAARLLQRKDLPEYSVHIIAQDRIDGKKHGQRFRLIDLDIIALQLRFISSTGRDRLSYYDTRVHPTQLQAMRRLTPASAILLESIWALAQPSPARKKADH